MLCSTTEVCAQSKRTPPRHAPFGPVNPPPAISQSQASDSSRLRNDRVLIGSKPRDRRDAFARSSIRKIVLLTHRSSMHRRDPSPLRSNMSVVIPFASPGCICAIASSTPPPASSGPLVHLPPRAHTSTPSRRSIWPVDTSPAMSPPNPDFKCCKLLQVESDEAHLKKCDASPVSPTGDAGVRRSECCKAHIEPVRRLVSHDFVRDV